MGSSNRTKKIVGSIVGTGLVALGLGALLMPVSGADFSASDTGNIAIDTATLSLGLGDNHGSVGTFNLDFDNIAPGGVVSDVVYITNTGSIPADVKIGQPLTNPSMSTPNSGVNGNPVIDPADLLYGVDGFVPLTPSTATASTVSLGALQPGETRGYALQFGLDSSAGNEWQDASISVDYTVTLDQQ